MVKKCYDNKKVMKAKWFDEDCRQATNKQKESRSKLKVFTSTRNDEDRREYVEARKRYKYLLKAKKQNFRRKKDNIACCKLEQPTNVLERIKKYRLREEE